MKVVKLIPIEETGNPSQEYSPRSSMNIIKNNSHLNPKSLSPLAKKKEKKFLSPQKTEDKS